MQKQRGRKVCSNSTIPRNLAKADPEDTLTLQAHIFVGNLKGKDLDAPQIITHIEAEIEIRRHNHLLYQEDFSKIQVLAF